MDASECDVIRYQPEDFEAARPTPVLACERIKEALASYACFTHADPPCPPHLRANGGGQSANGPKQYHGHPHARQHAPRGGRHGGAGRVDREIGRSARGRGPERGGGGDIRHGGKHVGATPVGGVRPQRQRVESAGVSHGMRIITAALNKVSARNFASINRQVTRGVKEGLVDATEVADALLTKCYTEDCYLKLYMRLLQDIRDAPGVHCAIKAFYDAYMQHPLPTFAPPPRDGSKQYDVFCDVVKAKKHAIGRHRTVLALMGAGALEASYHSDAVHQAFLIGIVRQHISRMGGSAPALSEDAQHAVDVLLEWAMDFVASTKGAGNLEEWRSLFQEDLALAYAAASPRVRFRIEDILEVCRRGHASAR